MECVLLQVSVIRIQKFSLTVEEIYQIWTHFLIVSLLFSHWFLHFCSGASPVLKCLLIHHMTIHISKNCLEKAKLLILGLKILMQSMLTDIEEVPDEDSHPETSYPSSTSCWPINNSDGWSRQFWQWFWTNSGHNSESSESSESLNHLWRCFNDFDTMILQWFSKMILVSYHFNPYVIHCTVALYAFIHQVLLNFLR